MKKIIKEKIKLLFENDLKMSYSKVIFKPTRPYQDCLEGFIYYGDKQKIPFSTNILFTASNATNYKIKIEINKNDELHNSHYVKNLFSNNLLIKNLKKIEELNFKYNNYVLTVFDQDSVTICLSCDNEISTLKHSFKLFLLAESFNKDSNVDVRLHKLSNYHRANINASFDEKKSALMTNSSMPYIITEKNNSLIDFDGHGRMLLPFNQSSIDTVLDIIYHNFFYYLTIKNDKKSIFEEISIKDVFNMKHEQLHDLFLAEQTVKYMIEI